MTTLRTLDDLYAVLTTEPDTHATADAYGLPRAAHEDAIDWTSLPTFGGEEPPHTVEIWSWDATRLLVGTCADDLEIVPRDRADLTIEASAGRIPSDWLVGARTNAQGGEETVEDWIRLALNRDEITIDADGSVWDGQRWLSQSEIDALVARIDAGV